MHKNTYFANTSLHELSSAGEISFPLLCKMIFNKTLNTSYRCYELLFLRHSKNLKKGHRDLKVPRQAEGNLKVVAKKIMLLGPDIITETVDCVYKSDTCLYLPTHTFCKNRSQLCDLGCIFVCFLMTAMGLNIIIIINGVFNQIRDHTHFCFCARC